MAIILISTDLLASSQLEGAASASGLSLQAVAPAKASEAIGDAEIVVIDLTAPNAAVGELLAAIRAQAPKARVLAFGPHVHKQKLQAAADAGCEVFTRGQFYQNAREIFARYAVDQER